MIEDRPHHYRPTREGRCERCGRSPRSHRAMDAKADAYYRTTAYTIRETTAQDGGQPRRPDGSFPSVPWYQAIARDGAVVYASARRDKVESWVDERELNRSRGR